MTATAAHSETLIARISTDRAAAHRIADALADSLDPETSAISLFESGPSWVVEVAYHDAAARSLITSVVTDTAGAAGDITFSTIGTRDWVAASLEGLKPVRAGRIVVHGAHDRDTVRINDVAIEIEAALAFGTGHHGTTSGCLLALDAELKKRRPRRGLDVGTGTGILALALAKQIKRKVVAGDIDAVAVEVSAHNARLNHAPHALDLYVAPGLRHAKADRPGHFDLIFANILAGPLRRLAPALARALSPDGTLILSGLLAMDVPGVIAAYRHQGVALASRSLREGWATLVMKKGGAAQRPRRPA